MTTQDTARLMFLPKKKYCWQLQTFNDEKWSFLFSYKDEAQARRALERTLRRHACDGQTDRTSTVTTQKERTHAATIARNARIFEMRNAGATVYSIAKTLCINANTVDRVLMGPPDGKPREAAEPTEKKNCLRCREEFTTTRYVFRCAPCRESTRHLEASYA